MWFVPTEPFYLLALLFVFLLVLAYSLRNYLFEFPYKNSFHSPSFISIYLLTKQMKMWQQNLRCAHVCTAVHIFEILRKSIANWQIGKLAHSLDEMK